MLGRFFASKATVATSTAPVTTAGTFVQTQLLATGNFFLLTVTPVAGSLALYLNGLYLTVGVDYTLSQNAITLLHKMLTETDVLTAWYLSPV